MIYLKDIPKSLEQGDICCNLPKISPTQINFSIIKEFWIENIKQAESGIPKKPIILEIQPSLSCGVILTQSCDIRPGSAILFAELRERKEEPFSSKPKGRMNQITKILHTETRFHYFPIDNSIEIFEVQKVLDFMTLFIIPYDFLKDNIKNFFIARLISDAQQVLREKISKFFTRLAFDDIMFLTNEEIAKYIKKNKLNSEDVKETLSKFNRKF